MSWSTQGLVKDVAPDTRDDRTILAPNSCAIPALIAWVVGWRLPQLLMPFLPARLGDRARVDQRVMADR